jgi:hypothetical protein
MEFAPGGFRSRRRRRSVADAADEDDKLAVAEEEAEAIHGAEKSGHLNQKNFFN